ncbi:enoyl-CoA hydratase-related protein [Dongia soli]|uniref:Enoyl-CoA hydratase-related protein n=1 Tax=Dongia soli TaxID=600628 RepID=A0ABU5E9B7_9PROT|nr:enoyl-CoA hydratase-related protein [Dongia soli]MDY0882746.1 enoyl-CoA hydratase-related protein [Dongia soli]
MGNFILVDRRDDIATVTLNRPKRHNAFDDRMIAELSRIFDDLSQDGAIRFIVLAAEGKSFSAGADLAWMQRVAGQTSAENEADALALAKLLQRIDACPKPVIGVVDGAAYGGGVGLLACCDIVLASHQAAFALSEVRLGLIPAVISPYVIAAIGARPCRRYFLTGERFSAEEGLRLGLVHRLIASKDLQEAISTLCADLRKGGPLAQAAAKDLILRVSSTGNDVPIQEWTASRIAELRGSAEGREGMQAFLDKRPPSWMRHQRV